MDIASLEKALRATKPEEGVTATAVPALSVRQSLGGTIELPHSDTPSLLLAVAGILRLHTPAGIMDYMPGQCSATSIDTPKRGSLLAPSEEGDLIVLSLEVPLSEVTAVMIDLDDEALDEVLEKRISPDEAEAADAALVEVFARLFALSQTGGSRARFLSKHLTCEAVFEMLMGSCGTQFLESVVRLQCANDIYAANSWIKEHYRAPFSVEELAQRWNMSPSAFHRKFKDAVGMGPLQCQKRLRLTEARRLMLDESANATEAAFAVGYESSSQFSRDYKKAFGRSPSEDMRILHDAAQTAPKSV